jgi:hypothetical protein
MCVLDDPTFARMAIWILVVDGGMCAHRFNYANAHRRFPITLVHVDINPSTNYYINDSTHNHSHPNSNSYSYSNPNSHAHSNIIAITVANSDADTRAHPNTTSDRNLAPDGNA